MYVSALLKEQEEDNIIEYSVEVKWTTFLVLFFSISFLEQYSICPYSFLLYEDEHMQQHQFIKVW